MRKVKIRCNDFIELSSDILRRGGSFIFKAHGSSMVPFIRDGDMLTVIPVEFSDLRVGDVALYRSEQNRAIVHRIMNKSVKDGRPMVMTRGDSSNYDDGWVRSEQLLGRVVSAQRGQKVRILGKGFRSRMARFWIMVHPIGPLLIGVILRIRHFLLHVPTLMP